MSKHTKGPWLQVADRDEIIIYANSGPKGDDPICFTSDSRSVEEIQANARLIAAAPELLEALEDVLATKSLIMKRSPSELELHEILKTFERVKEAIFKATNS